MTHTDAGHYAGKHPDDTTCDPGLADAVRKRAKDGVLSCSAAHKLAEEQGVAPEDVGKVMDLLEYRITKCQLGLFGYAPEKKIVRPADTVAPEFAQAVKQSLVRDRLPCAACWSLAKTFGLTRMQASEALEAMGIKVKPCQLGAF